MREAAMAAFRGRPHAAPYRWIWWLQKYHTDFLSYSDHCRL